MKNPALGGAFILSAMAEWNSHLLSLLTQRSKLHRYPITSSALASRAGGIAMPGTFVADDLENAFATH